MFEIGWRYKALCCALGVIGCLAGCAGGAVQFAPTAPPPEAVPLTYQHPSGAFSLVLPPNWSVYSQHLSNLATASFAPPHSAEPVLLVAVADLGAPIEASALGELLFQYQTQIRPDAGRYTEQDRQVMGDGSWRLTGVRLQAIGAPLAVNTFIQRSGSLLAIAEVVVPADPTLRAQVQTIINTLAIGPQSDLTPSDMSAFAKMTSSALEVVNVYAWTTPQGVFFITGEVANRGLEAVGDVPVRGTLWSAGDVGLAEALDTVMAYSIGPGEFAPFSLRFGQGQPSDSAYYRVEIGYDNWQPSPSPSVVGAEALSWTDSVGYNQSDQLQIYGIITNVSADTVRDVRAIVTVFDADERVIAAGYTPAQPQVLASGAAANYLLVIPELGGAPAHYIVNVQGRVGP